MHVVANKMRSLSLKPYNTFGIDVNASEIIEVQSVEQLISISDLNKCLFIGGGSNILLTKDVSQRVVINKIKGIETISEDADQILLKIASGENWHDLVLFCIDNGYGGLENMSLIPGSVGAAPMQNIGAYGTEIKDLLTYVKAIHLDSLAEKTFQNEECQFGYRDSIFKKRHKGKYFISEIGLRLTKRNHKLNTNYGDIENWLNDKKIERPTIKDISDAVISIRKSKLPDPKELGNSGSFFKNPIIHRAHLNMLKIEYPEIKSYPISDTLVKVPAGWLIETLGWKGRRVGRTGSHINQALVLVNYGGASGSDVHRLAKNIQEDVWEEFQIELEMEVNII